MWVRSTSLWCYCLTEVELQFNVKLSSPGKTWSVRSADYTPAQAPPSCCCMSGRSEEGLHHCLKWSLKSQLVGQCIISPLPASFEIFNLRASLSSPSHPLSFPVIPFLSPSHPSPSSSFLTSVCGVWSRLTPSIKWLCPPVLETWQETEACYTLIHSVSVSLSISVSCSVTHKSYLLYLNCTVGPFKRLLTFDYSAPIRLVSVKVAECKKQILCLLSNKMYLCELF